jgi:immunity protein 44 of polymorphic toxin system
MRFFFSGEVDAQVGDQYRRVRREVAATLNAQLGDRDYGGALNEIAIIPMILGPRFAQGRKERRLIKHAEKIADYRLFIDYDAWIAGTEDDRKRLLVENILASVRDIARKLNGFDGERLAQDIRNLFPKIQR